MKTMNKNVMAIVISVGLALLCAVLLKVVVDKKIAASLDENTVSYVVANTDLPAGSIVNPFDKSKYAIRGDIPEKFAQSTAITPNQVDSINGALLLADLKRGDIVTWQAIDTDERRQLASRLLPGRRALTIPVDDQSSIASMLKPDDHIDLILTYQKAGNIIAAPLLQNVRVLATGDILSQSGSYTKAGYDDSFRTITLDLTIDNVSKVTTALELGRLSAVLRNPEDLSYTTNVVSLDTLQRELNLKTFADDESLNSEFVPEAYLNPLATMPQMSEALVANNPTNKEPVANGSTIQVIYGNRNNNNKE